MDVREIAADYAALVAAGQMEEAARKYWADDIVTSEAEPGEMSRTQGIEEAVRKAEWWLSTHEIRHFRSEGPFLNGDTFLLIMDMDVVTTDGTEIAMREIVGYRVAGGKVVEERYYY